MIYRKFIGFLLLLCIATVSYAQCLKIATYNIRLDTPKDSLNAWPYRVAVVNDLIRFYDFDIFGIQEGFLHQLEDIKKGLPQYNYIGVGREDGKQSGEFSAIFYKKDRFKLLQSGTFWLSATDTEHPNKGWDAAFPRICTWGQFEDKVSGFRFFHLNTHFDHIGVTARKESATLILDKIKKIAEKTPVILSGDFNVDQYNESYLLINNSGKLKDAFELAPIKLATNGTFNNFDINTRSDSRIDHIFLSEKFKVRRYGILTDSYQGRLPSDHFPVFVEVDY